MQRQSDSLIHPGFPIPVFFTRHVSTTSEQAGVRGPRYEAKRMRP